MRRGRTIGRLGCCLLLVAACGEQGAGERGADAKAPVTQAKPPARQTEPPPSEPSPHKDSGGPPPVTTPPATPQPADPGTPGVNLEALRLNQWQTRGTHNSYHLRPPENPTLSWQYDMPPLGDQLAQYGMRALEFDVHAINGELHVFHLFVDPVSTCPTLPACLGEVAAWSQANPGHFPLFLFLEQKNAWNTADVERVDAAVRAAFGRDVLFKPDDFTRGVYPSVRAALEADGWPALGAMRGRVLVSLVANQAMTYFYTSQGSSLAGRAMFVAASSAGPPHVVVLAHDYPIEQEAAIREAVQQGYLVRTRSDQYPGQINDPAAMHRAALRSGAHILLTDYPAGSAYFPGYLPALPGGAPARCKPVTTAQECTEW